MAIRGSQSGAVKAEWNPTKGPPAGAKYVGDRVCSSCHADKGKTYPSTPMGQAASEPSKAQILLSHPRLTFRQGPYRYLIFRRGTQTIYSVSNGRQTISAPVIWAFGKGAAGQTYVFRWKGAYYQSRVSFFNDIQGLDLTMGSPRSQPPSLEYALGVRMNEDGIRACVVCHTTRAVAGGQFQPMQSVPGVHCEACHGPGANHVAAMKAGKVRQGQTAIFNPGHLSAGRLDDFCGSCHRSWAQVELMGMTGIRNVRFQPYRLQNSRCWGPTDARISCLACHDPHRPLETKVSFFTSRCLACHILKGAKPDVNHPGPACPVSSSRCISCHMPKYEFPGGHYAFTDHDIRIVRPGAPYPD